MSNNNNNHSHSHSHGGMDFRNLCQRLDVNSLRARLPALPALPQLKLPKALPKLKTRKIFRSSRENVSEKTSPQQQATAARASASHAQFINHTPTRISTISSLMHEQEQLQQQQHRNTYFSAGSVDDDYYTGRAHDEQHASRPISPVRLPAGSAVKQEPPLRPSLTQRLQRGYKDLSEFRLKHIFAKKTVVRRDGIEVQHYVEQYDEERRLEQLAQQRRDREIADNYKIKFTVARQDTIDSLQSVQNTPNKPKPSVGELSGDESGMETTPPSRKPGIAATRFSKVRNPPLPMPEQESKTEQKQQQPSSNSYKQRLKRLHSKEQLAATGTRLLTKLPSLTGSKPKLTQELDNPERKRRAPLSPQQSLEQQQPEQQTQQQPISGHQAIRQNIQRLHKSIKGERKPKIKQTQSADESDDETDKAAAATNIKPKRGSRFTAQLRRFRSREEVPQQSENATTGLSTRLQQHWRKNFKKSSEEQSSPEKDAHAEPPRRSDTLLQKLRHMRARKAPSQDELDGEEAEPSTSRGMAAQLEERFTQARQRTMKKVNEKMGQIKLFQRSEQQQRPEQSTSPESNKVQQEHVEIDDDNELEATYHNSSSSDNDGNSDQDIDELPEPPRRQRRGGLSHHEGADSIAAQEIAALGQLQARRSSSGGNATITAWTTEPILCEESLDLDDAEDIDDATCDYPRVLIHQDHSDAFESTLIIAVTQRTAASASPTAKNNTSAPLRRSSATDWIPNQQIISNFRATEEAAWQVQKPTASALYKPKSIDIFEASNSQDGASGAFADFDDALRNAPVVAISAQDSDSSKAELTTTSSTQIKRQIGNSRESLIAHMSGEQEDSDAEDDEDNDEEEDDDNDEYEEYARPPSAAPSPPPQCSPPPPPLPDRRPPPQPPQTAAPIYDAVPPPLPISKPPPLVAVPLSAPLPQIPERSASMSRPTKPLVKTSSLRLTYNEQVRPGDVGKVNKLISRFEGPQQRTRPRLIARRLHSEEYEVMYSDEEAEASLDLRDTTPTPANINQKQRAAIPEIVTTSANSSNNNNNNNDDDNHNPKETLPIQQMPASTLSLDRHNSNCSRSEYGSPLAYPSSLRGSNNNTPTGTRHTQRQQQQPQQIDQLELQRQTRRNRRSMTRDDDNFYSFDSDEENSYYSISPSGSSRYVVEI